ARRAEDEALAEAVRPEAVRAVDRHAGRLANREEAGDRRLSLRIGRDPAHHVMLPGPHGDRFTDRVEAHVLLRELADHRDALLDLPLPEVAEIQSEVLAVGALERAARLHLLDHRPRQ